MMIKIHEKFGTNAEELSQTAAASADKAKEKYAALFASEEEKKNEILFDCFNFVCQKNLTITADKPTNESVSVTMSPSNKSLYDLYKDGSIQVNMGCNLSVTEVKENKYFEFTMSSFLACVYAKDIDGFKQNDFVQFAYDLNATVRVEFVAVDNTEDNRYDMGVQCSFNSNATQSFGFIQMRKGGSNYPAVSINNMTEVSYDGNCYHRGFYTKS